MEFKSNPNNPQILEINNQISAKAIVLFLQDHTFISWQKMMDIWLNGYTHSPPYQGQPGTIQITPFPRPNGGFWGGGGHGDPSNYKTTIQYLMDHGFVTFTHINGFKLLASTKKTKSITNFGTKNFPVSSKNLTKYNHLNFG
jgi:hypothetical protein